MRLEDYQRKVFEDVGGLYRKGTDDNCPEDHFTDSLNIWHEISEWRTRPGLSSNIILGYGGNVQRFQFFSPICLVLDDQGNLYTISSRLNDNATTPIINVPGAVDFSAIKMLGKIFIAFHDGQHGLAGINLKVYIPDPINPVNDIIRDAAGLAPITAVSAADGSSGIVNAGVYQIAVSFVTSTGFITPPSPLTTYTAPGSKKISITNIPLGPTGTVQRQILITKANLTELFFLASAFGGLINDNTTTTATLNFNDTTQLLNSADYLNNLLQTIPAPLVMHNYNGRLVMSGQPAPNDSILTCSRIGDVESIDQTSAFYFVNIDDGFSIRNLLALRGTLYIAKNLGAWYVTDNGNDPSEWPEAQSFDENVGVPVHGIAEFYNSEGIRVARDWTLIVDRSGILLFNGTLQKPQVTNKIGAIWSNINFLAFHRIQLAVDDQHHKIYCTIPQIGSNEANLFIVGDYSLCPGKIPESTKIKWAIWQFKTCGFNRRVTSVGLFNYYPPDTVPTLKIGSLDGTGRIYTLDPNSSTDDGQDIQSYWEGALIFWEPGNVHTFTASRLRIIGYGTLSNSVRGEDNVNNTNIPPIILSPLDWRFFQEIPEGAINGINSDFSACYFNSGQFLLVFQNGLLVLNWTNPFSNEIAFVTPPLINDTIQFIYIIDPNNSQTTTFNTEIPTGTINGINTTFTLSASVPVSETSNVLLWQNGLLLRNGVDFTVSGTTITMIVAPLTNDTLYAAYHKDILQLGWILEDKSSLIDGSTFMFTLNNTPSREFVGAFQNGLLIRKYIDYQIIGTTIILSNFPAINDTLQFVYRKVSVSSGLGLEKLIRYNFQNEKAKIKFNLPSGQMTISKMEHFGYPKYPMRPM